MMIFPKPVRQNSLKLPFQFIDPAQLKERIRSYGMRNIETPVLGAIALPVLLLVFAGQALADPPRGYPFQSYDQGLASAVKSNKPIFVYFGREGCGYCDFTNKNAFSDAKVRRSYQDHYELIYVDAESGKRLTLPSGERITERDLGARFKAFVTPVFVFLAPDGKQILKRIGVQRIEDLLNYDRYISEGYYRSRSLDQFLTEDG